jgi:hypothetical protein
MMAYESKEKNIKRDNVDMVNKVIMVDGYYEYDSEVAEENQEDEEEEEEVDEISEDNYRIIDIHSYVLEDEEKKSLFKKISTFYQGLLLKPLRVIEQENLDKRRKKLEQDFKEDMARNLSNIRLSRAAKEARLDEIMRNIPTETRATKEARMKKIEEEQKERVREMNRLKHEREVKRNKKINSTDIQIIKKKIQEKKPTIIKIVRAQPIAEAKSEQVPEAKVVIVETERERFIREKNTERESRIQALMTTIKEEEVPYVVEIEEENNEEDDGEKEAMQQAIETAINIMKKWSLEKEKKDLYKAVSKPVKTTTIITTDDSWSVVSTKKVKNTKIKLNIVLGAKSYKQESYEKRVEKRAEIESQKKLEEEKKKKEDSRYTTSEEEDTTDVEDVKTEELSETEIKRSQAFEKLKESKDKVISKSKMCSSFGTNKPCRHGGNCRFAHTVDELSPSECFFGTDCKFLHCPERLCVFIHEQETKIQYCQRLGIKIPRKSTPVTTKVKTEVVTQPRVLITKLERSAWQIPLNIVSEIKKEEPLEKKPIEVTQSRLCRSVGSGMPCPHGDKCRFSHSEISKCVVESESDSDSHSESDSDSDSECAVPLPLPNVIPVVLTHVYVSENDNESWTENKPKRKCEKKIPENIPVILCRSVGSGKPCAYGAKCRFEHPGESKKFEIKNNTKLVMCRSVGTGKPCVYGSKCRFAHK